MDIILICIFLGLVLFIPAFIARRRFGLLGLALAAGSLLSNIWGYDAGLVAGIFGVPVNPLSTAIITSLIIVLPAVILLFHGARYKNIISRIIGAGLFTLLAFAFLVEPLGRVVMSQGLGMDVYNLLVNNRLTIIGSCLVLAVVDLFLTKPAHHESKNDRTH